jgi:hypothetical protein
MKTFACVVFVLCLGLSGMALHGGGSSASAGPGLTVANGP